MAVGWQHSTPSGHISSLVFLRTSPQKSAANLVAADLPGMPVCLRPAMVTSTPANISLVRPLPALRSRTSGWYSRFEIQDDLRFELRIRGALIACPITLWSCSLQAPDSAIPNVWVIAYPTDISFFDVSRSRHCTLRLREISGLLAKQVYEDSFPRNGRYTST